MSCDVLELLTGVVGMVCKFRQLGALIDCDAPSPIQSQFQHANVERPLNSADLHDSKAHDEAQAYLFLNANLESSQYDQRIDSKVTINEGRVSYCHQ